MKYTDINWPDFYKFRRDQQLKEKCRELAKTTAQLIRAYARGVK